MKKALSRGALGIPIGITIGYGITVVMDLAFGGGEFSPVVPAMAEAFGTESAAVAVQFGLLCVMGFVFGFASCAWEVENWSLLKQTVIHFCSITPTAMLAAGICRWAEYTPGGLWGYFAIFVAIYVLIFIIEMLAAREKVKRANQKLSEKKETR